MGHRKDFGPRVVLTDDFRDDLEVWLKAEKGRTAKKLAKLIGCDPSLISQIRHRKIETSDVVVPIVKLTGIAMPTAEADKDAVLLAQLRRLSKVDPATYDALVALVRARLGEK